MADPEPTPIACTLNTNDLKARMAWIARLNKAALKESCRSDLRLELIYDVNARDDVRQMVRGEQECCAFLTFNVREELRAIRVTIEAPETARDAVEAMFAPFLPEVSRQRGGDCGCCGGTS